MPAHFGFVDWLNRPRFEYQSCVSVASGDSSEALCSLHSFGFQPEPGSLVLVKNLSVLLGPLEAFCGLMEVAQGLRLRT